MRSSPFLALLGPALLLAGHSAAQTQYFVVPQAYANTEGGSTNNYPFGVHLSRTQMVYNGAQLGFKLGAMYEVTFRRDGTNTAVFTQKSIPLKVFISVSPNTDRTASLAFAENRGPNPVKVFDGFMNLPQSIAPATPPAPFDVTIPFTAPWIYIGGNLCLEFEGPGPKATVAWHIDCFYTSEGGRGSSLEFGTPCASQAPSPPKDPVLSITTSQLLIGKTASISLNAYRTNVPCLLFLGPSKTQWGPLALPFDLTAMGAKGCQILVDAGYVFAAMSDPALSTAPAKFGLPVPNQPGFVNYPFTIQGFVINPGDNALGLLSTQGADITFGTSSVNWEGVQLIFSTDPAAPAGYTAAGNQGAVTRFGGVLQ